MTMQTVAHFAPRSQADINALKARWVDQPLWNIEETPGFEAHRDELTSFADQQLDKWAALTLERFGPDNTPADLLAH